METMVVALDSEETIAETRVVSALEEIQEEIVVVVLALGQTIAEETIMEAALASDQIIMEVTRVVLVL